jgi:osmoprotectant transport system permease protein
VTPPPPPPPSGPVIPSFGEASSCVSANRFWCGDWVRDHWHDTLAPALWQHIELSAIAVGIGFVISFALALLAYRVRRVDTPIGAFSDFLYTIPSLALFQLLVPFTGLTVTTVEIALVSYTLVILFRNTLEGLRSTPADVVEAARGMGLNARQRLFRVELPLAVPAIVAGLRIAAVSTISITTIAAFVIPEGLGRPLFIALESNVFKTEIIAAGGLAIGLALVVDASLALLNRVLTPWATRGRGE